MAKSLVMFDLYNTLITDPMQNDRQHYRIDAVWSLIDKAGFPVRFADVIEVYESVIESMNRKHKEHLGVNVFDMVLTLCKKLNIYDIAMIKKIYDTWSYASLQIVPTLLPHIEEGLKILKEDGKKIALISNTGDTPGIALRFFLLENKIYHYFDDIVFSDEFGFMKPKTMIFERVLQKLCVTPQDSVFVGDHEQYDKVGAENAGIDYIEMNPNLNFRTIIEQVREL